MGLFNHFPYPDTHQLNLDWILDAVKNCVDKVTELWTYVREPGAGIQKALTDAQAAATSAQTNATSAQASAANARTSAINAEANAANAQTSANDAQTSADDAQTSADDAQAAATTAVQAMMGKLYPVGAFYTNLRAASESDETVIARLEALTGGTWAIAGIYGQPVQEPADRGHINFVMVDAIGTNVTYNINIYVRTA